MPGTWWVLNKSGIIRGHHQLLFMENLLRARLFGYILTFNLHEDSVKSVV